MDKPSRAGEACRDWKGDREGEVGTPRGVKVKRNRRGSSCQKLRLLTNMLDQLLESLDSIGCKPTDDSSLEMRPMRSSF